MQVNINGQAIGLAETVTISRSVGRTPHVGVGDPRWVDAPPTQFSVTVSATMMIPKNGANTLAGTGITPNGSLMEQLTVGTYPIDLIDPSTGTIEYSVQNCYWNTDSLQTPAADILSGSVQWIGQDTGAWH